MTSAVQTTVSSEKTWVHVASFCDANMVMAAGALLCSLKRHRAADTALAITLFVDESVNADIHLLVDELVDSSFQVKVYRLHSNEFQDHGGPSDAGMDLFDLSTQYRLKIDQYLPDLDKVLYLDADTIVRRDVAPLWAIDFNDELVAAMPDYNTSSMQSQLHLLSYGEHKPSFTTYVETEIQTRYVDYFNAGVMLINLRQWRREDVGARCLAFIRSHPRVIYPDQDALNHVAKRRYIALDPRWNSFAFVAEGYGDSFYDPREDCGPLSFVRRLWARDPWIIHFTWTSKPWIPDGVKTAHDAEFWSHVASTNCGRKAMTMFRPREDALHQNQIEKAFEAPSVGEPLGASVVIPPRPQPSYDRLPTISFVVVNCNYGRFLRQCVESILLQDYPLIECIIVDDVSTDDSRTVIEDLQARYPALMVHFRSVNGGQSLCCKDGFEASRGAFVAFIDADDFLLPTYATSHVHAHLSLPSAVGFTSSDMAQMVDQSIVTTNYFESNGVIVGERLQVVPFHKLKHVGKTSRAAERQFNRPLPTLRSVQSDEQMWVWAPMSGNVYRRDAVALFMDNPRLASLRTATDGYLNIAINAFTGSVLIDDTLAVYRIHGANTFTRRGPLQGLLSFAKEKDFTGYAAFCALEHVTRNFRQFEAMTFQIDDLSRALKRLELLADRHNPRRRLWLRRLVSFATVWRWRWQARALTKVYDHRKAVTPGSPSGWQHDYSPVAHQVPRDDRPLAHSSRPRPLPGQ